jgi:hypothetical protein
LVETAFDLPHRFSEKPLTLFRAMLSTEMPHMMPLFDLIAKAQNGQGMELLARQFNLNQQQTQVAMEALLPAFSEGLKRNTSDPMGMGSFLQAMGSGNHAKYFEDATSAFSQSGVAEGNGILGHLFGNKDVSRAVAAQAASATGLGQEILKQMLPVIASMVMGGLFKQSTGQMSNAAGMGTNPIGDIIEQMMKQGMGAGRGQQAPAPSPMDNPLGKILEGMLGGALGGPANGDQQQPQGQNPFGNDNPWGKMLEEMMKGAQGTPAQNSAPQDEPQQRRHAPEPEPQASNPLEDIFGKMFETGRQTQDTYQKGVKSIFDQYLQNMERNR